MGAAVAVVAAATISKYEFENNVKGESVMKKWMIAVVALALCLSLCGCFDRSEQIPNDSTESAPVESTSTTSDTKPSETVEGDLDEEIAGAGTLSYAEFISKSPEDQQAYMNSFGTDLDGIQQFMAWYTEAKAEYDAERESQENAGGSIDIGDYVGKESENPQ